MSNIILISHLIWASYTDLRDQTIDDVVHVGLITYAFLASLFLFGFPSIKEGVYGFIIGGAIMFLLYLTGAMGFGDVKLMAALGTWFGFQIIEVFLVSFIVGLAFSIFFIIKNRVFRQVIPFGPSIAIAAIIVWIYDIHVISNYF